MREPDFYFTSAGDPETLSAPRACWVVRQMHDFVRGDHMLINVDPPAIGQAYGLGCIDVTTLLISSRFKGDTLFPISEWPCHVYVSRVIDDAVLMASTFSANQVEIIAWGAIYKTLGEAADAGQSRE